MKNTSTYHKGLAVPLNRDNIDTDQIIPNLLNNRLKKVAFGQIFFIG